MGIKIDPHSAKRSADQGLGSALLTSSQQRVLGFLFGQPERSFFANELIKLTGAGSGSVQRELKKLADSGLVISEMRGNQRYLLGYCPSDEAASTRLWLSLLNINQASQAMNAQC